MGGTIVLMLIEVLLILLALLISKAIKFTSPSFCGDQLLVADDRTKDDVILTQTASPPSSHIVVSPPTTKYDVFLSFRGEDTRHTFASYLYNGLCNAGIHTFMDYELRKGEHISQILLRAIEESEISMIIFSEKYASSTWCLDELVHILECKEKFGRVVIPIFYNIDPSNIRKQNGSFGKGFDDLKRRFEDNPEKLQKWVNALIQSASLSGWDSNSISCARPEFKLIEEIVKDILSRLNHKLSCHLEGLVGIACHIKNVENLLIEARIVGIWGMGGAGKTTLAKAIFQVLRFQFDAFSFIENVNGQLKRISLDELQQNCLKEVLEDKDICIYDIKSISVKKRLGRKKILIILDDVDNSRIVEDLTKVLYWCGDGSRIIVTSRDKQVLQNAYEKTKPRSTQATYHLLGLDFNDAIRLFSLKAFKQHKPSEGYMELSRLVVQYCQGNPLALVVLGCSLYGREKEEWESALEKLDKDPPKEVVDVLKLSFDGLDEKQQNMFLDLAFLINERVGISLNLIRQLYDSSALIEISVLKEKILISFDNCCYIGMHDLVKKMGLGIARNQLISNAKTPIRLWCYEDLNDFFSGGKAIEAIRCMSLDMSKIKRITLRVSIFRKMRNLIFLKIYKSNWRKPSMLNICGVLDYLSEKLRFLSWEDYPLPYVPLHFCAENLLTLEMRNSNIRRLWKGNQYFPNLGKIDLSGSKHLTALLDLSQTPMIEELNLKGCVNLGQIRVSTFKGMYDVNLMIGECGPMLIKVGGSIKGTSSGLVIESGYLDLRNLSFNKMTLKWFVCGNMICGVRFKHEAMPLEEIKELRKEAQSLGSLLPFVSKIACFEGPIEFGHDFNQHFDYFFDYCGFSGVDMEDYNFNKTMMNDDLEDYDFSDVDEEESGVDEEMGDRGEMMNGHQVVTSSLMEDDKEDHVLMEDWGSKRVILARVPNIVTCWSLLKELTLKSLPLSNEYCRRIKPLLDVTLSSHDIHSFDDIIPPYGYSHNYLCIYYDLGPLFDRRVVAFNCGPADSIYGNLYVVSESQSGGKNRLLATIQRKRG